MNWDVSIGSCRQFCGRVMQTLGHQFGRRALVLAGERSEYRGRLQARYGWLKHHEQWGSSLARIPRQPLPARADQERILAKRSGI